MRTQAEEHRRRRLRSKEDGRCIWCHRPATKGGSLCATHRTQQRKKVAQWRAKGLCPHCGTEDYDGEWWACAKCRELDANRKAALIEFGLCRVCGRENDSEFQACNNCRERINTARRAKRATAK